MLNKIINNIKDKINNIKKENENYNISLNNSIIFDNLKPLTQYNNYITEKNINYIIQNSPDINKEKATLICKLIPIDETFISISYTKEIKTNTEYYILLTNKYIWIISNNGYKIINYSNINSCTIIKNNLMSKIINFNNIILEINGNNESINNFINILTNENYRNQIILTNTSYLCGIIPIYQKINYLNSGISISNDKNIVFHTKDFNYKYNYQNITNYEIMLDNTTITSKEKRTNITSMQNSCYTISLRITTKDKQFLIPILEQNSLGSKYNYQDSVYQKNIKFAYELIYKLDELYKI